MGRLVVLSLLALLTVAEIAAVIAIYDWVGPLGTLMVLGLDMLLGLMVMRGAMADQSASDRGWKIAGGAIIALPGLVLDLVGIALLLPPTRGLIKRALERNVATVARRSGVSVITVTGADGTPQTAVVPGDVIEGEVIPPTGSSGPGSASPGGPTTPPTVIRGEIVAGPESPTG